jgi:predicted Zn finger-like uncharacterized protein
MIIQCDKCATKFRLDDSRITPHGVKVRCTKCDNVFIVTPPPPPEEVQVEELFGVAPGMDAGGLQPNAPPPKPKEDSKHLSFDFDSEVTREDIFKTPSDAPLKEAVNKFLKNIAVDEDFGAGQGFPPEQKSSEEKKFSIDDLDFSFSEDRSSENKTEDDREASKEGAEEDEDPFAGVFDKPLDEDEPTGAEVGLSADSRENAKDASDELDFSFGDLTAESPKATPPWPAEEEEVRQPEPQKQPVAENVIPFSAAAYTKEGKASEGPPQDEPEEKEEDVAFKTVLSRAVERDAPLYFEGPDEQEEEETEEEDPRPVYRTGQPKMGLIVAALVIVLGGGLIYFTGVIDKLTHLLMPAAEIKVVENRTIKGFYEENKNWQALRNRRPGQGITDSPQEIKAATGVIYNDSGDKIAEKSVSPGRIVSIDDVRNLQKEELERAFRDPSGGVIPPKGSVPVMVLFIEIPEGLSEFGVDIVR